MTTADNGEAAHPRTPGKEALRPELPKRFYKDVAVASSKDGFAVLLDSRPVRTPRKRQLAVPQKPLADAIAEEWAAQSMRIDPATMPMTRILNSAIDAVADHAEDVAADIVAFAGSDLTCYRAEAPELLVRRQGKAWDPVLAWVRQELGARFEPARGVMPVEQSAAALARIAAAIAPLPPIPLAALHVMTTLTGSALLALASARGRLGVDQAWAAAHVDEDWQIELWGRDEEAAARRQFREAEFLAAARILRLSGAE